MKKFALVSAALLAAASFMTACNAAEATASDEVGLPNPASVYCEEQGYTLEMRIDEGGEHGVCKFPDGSECEEWAFFRGECQPGDSLKEKDTALLPEAPVWEEETSGWLTYTNERYGYSISYPETATITEYGVMSYPTDELPDGMTSEEYIAQLEEEYGNNFCVEIKYSLGYIYIAADWETTSKYGICGRTGVGVGELIDKTENIVIGGVSYSFTGFEFLGGGELLQDHNETLVGYLNDGARIEFGSSPRDDATFEDYLMKTRDVLLQIIASYQPIE